MASEEQGIAEAMADGRFTFDTATGVGIPDAQTCIEDAQERMKEIFGRDIDTSVLESPMGRFVEAVGILRRSVMAMTARSANQMNLALAGGLQLDAIASFFGLERKSATSTTVRLACTGKGGTTIPVESVVSDTQGNLYETTESATIPASGGTVYVKARCQTTGRIVPDVYTIGAENSGGNFISRITKATVGWTGVSCAEVLSVGGDEEGDAAFRKRIAKSRNAGRSFLDSISASVGKINGVYSAYVYENAEGTAKTVGGVLFPPHSVAVIVDCDESATVKKAVAEAVFGTKSVGATLLGLADYGCAAVEYPVAGPYFGNSYPVVFNFPARTAYTLVLDVQRNRYSGMVSIPVAVGGAVSSWLKDEVPDVDAPGMGRMLSEAEAAAAVSTSLPELKVVTARIYKQGYDPNDPTSKISNANRVETRICPLYEKPFFGAVVVRVHDANMDLIAGDSATVFADGTTSQELDRYADGSEVSTSETIFALLFTPTLMKAFQGEQVARVDLKANGTDSYDCIDLATRFQFFGNGPAWWEPVPPSLSAWIKSNGDLDEQGSVKAAREGAILVAVPGSSLTAIATTSGGTSIFRLKNGLSGTGIVGQMDTPRSKTGDVFDDGNVGKCAFYPVFQHVQKYDADKAPEYAWASYTHPAFLSATDGVEMSVSLPSDWLGGGYQEDEILVKVQTFVSSTGGIDKLTVTGGGTTFLGNATFAGQSSANVSKWCVATRENGLYTVRMKCVVLNRVSTDRVVTLNARVVNLAY